MADKQPKWQADFKLVSNQFTHPKLVELEMELALQPIYLTTASQSRAAAYLKAAIASGWIAAPETSTTMVEEGGKTRRVYFYDGQEVGSDAGLHPGKIRWLGNQIVLAYQQSTDIPPN